ncbi:uncharacterized protein LOC129606382 isoform X2 [Condylostylus longicornis]|uniref:uncharacterized protein LOC129606382 isoform X2 n=1 Tax=Condylostylus longicornis TaxID=2530218 RepID=UPI00244DF572|nr:uncharacterized protein LOC129606382 isoform X2 [Condylostylus longicornis]
MAEGIEETENNSSSADTPAMLGTVIPCEAITAALGGMKREFDSISNSSGIDTGGGGGGSMGISGSGSGNLGIGLITRENDGRISSPSSMIHNKDGTISPISMSIDTTSISKSMNAANMPTPTSLNNSSNNNINSNINTISSSSSSTTIGTSNKVRSSISPQPPPLSTATSIALSTTSLSSASSSSSSSSSSLSLSVTTAPGVGTASSTSGNVHHQIQQHHPINLKSEVSFTFC